MKRNRYMISLLIDLRERLGSEKDRNIRYAVAQSHIYSLDMAELDRAVCELSSGEV